MQPIQRQRKSTKQTTIRITTRYNSSTQTSKQRNKYRNVYPWQVKLNTTCTVADVRLRLLCFQVDVRIWHGLLDNPAHRPGFLRHHRNLNCASRTSEAHGYCLKLSYFVLIVVATSVRSLKTFFFARTAQELAARGLQRRAELPQRRNQAARPVGGDNCAGVGSLDCQAFVKRGACRVFNEKGRCNYHHPLGVHTVEVPGPRCPQVRNVSVVSGSVIPGMV